MITSFVPDGVRVVWPFTSKLSETVRLLLIVVVPVFAPIERVVAAPAKFTVAAVALIKLNVGEVVVRSPPFNAKSPAEVIFPVSVEDPSIVRLPFAEISPVFVSVVPVEP